MNFFFGGEEVKYYVLRVFERKSVTRNQILYKAVWVSRRANSLGKGMNPYLPNGFEKI